ncbi:MAG: lycopene cyclase family protein [Actinomycetota bacterium]
MSDVAVAVVGDGPAGSSVAAELHRRGVDVALIGPGTSWPATYATWVDEVPAHLVDSLAWVTPTTTVAADRLHPLERAYGVFDNDLLATTLRRSVSRLADEVTSVDERAEPGGLDRGAVVQLSSGDALNARLVVDATGWPSALVSGQGGGQKLAFQTAFGVVLEDPPQGDLGAPMFMDVRDVVGRNDASIGRVPTFCYALGVADGWLVEETVLAAQPAIEPVALVPRLARRLGVPSDDLLDRAVRTEYVRIPMGVAPTQRTGSVVVMGAGAGYGHPATGFSVAASLRAASRVASAIADADGHGDDIVDAAADAVWPRSMRRTRALHDLGLSVLLELDQAGVRQFFDRFFELPTEQWAAYLRIDAEPRQVSAAMLGLFRKAPWSLRRRVAVRNPAPLLRALAGS